MKGGRGYDSKQKEQYMQKHEETESRPDGMKLREKGTGYWWLTPVIILATWEAEIRRITV
jgi:hypothetical protein